MKECMYEGENVGRQEKLTYNQEEAEELEELMPVKKVLLVP